MPVYDNVQPMDYYPHPEQVMRGIFAGLELGSILDVGAGHGGVFDLERWETDPQVVRKEACDIFWMREMPAGWVTRTGIDACQLRRHYHASEFDFVQCCEVLEHIPDSRRALMQLVDVARKVVFITSADETHHEGPEQVEIEKFNKHQAYVKQPSIEDLLEFGFEVRVDSQTRRQIIAWLIK